MQCFAADDAMGEIGQQAHEAGHPERKIGERHPRSCGLAGPRTDPVDRHLPALRGGYGLVEHGEKQAEDGLLRVVLGEGLVEQFGVEAEDGETGGIDRLGER